MNPSLLRGSKDPHHPTAKLRDSTMDPHVKLKLTTALIKYDQRQRRGKYHNPHALGIYLKGLAEVEREVDAGASVARAIYDNFNDRLLTALEKAVGVPVTYGGGSQDKGRPA
jgi:hypothetical protein